MEDKQEICNALLNALQRTRACADLLDLTYYEGQGIVVGTFEAGGRITINVMADSGMAMIFDIIKMLR